MFRETNGAGGPATVGAGFFPFSFFSSSLLSLSYTCSLKAQPDPTHQHILIQAVSKTVESENTKPTDHKQRDNDARLKHNKKRNPRLHITRQQKKP